jgi:hypothetical protein
MATTSMSTPISQLPSTHAAPGNVRHDEDQIVSDVISEMQGEYPKPAPHPHPQVVQQFALPSSLPPPPSYYHQQPSELLFGVLDKDHVMRAAIAAIIALAFFYPDTLSPIYEKIPTVGSFLESNDKIVRALLLAIVLYIILWKME